MKGGVPKLGATGLLRLDPLTWRGAVGEVTFSGGVSEYVYGWETQSFGDLGSLLAAEIRQGVASWGPRLEPPAQGIRATVIGASQYTTQVSGSTIFVSPYSALPLRNVPVIAPGLLLEGETIDSDAIAASIRTVLRHLDLGDADTPVAIFVPWQGSATFHRLDAFCRGVADGLRDVLARGHPIVLAGDGDVGGLIGIHFREEMKLTNPVVSIDGLELKQFDYIDIGELLESSGAVPVVIKSLIFPASAALGQEWMANR
jgi:ethanolamine utilization protein EutA